MKKIALFIFCLGFTIAAQAQQATNVVPENSPASAAPEMTAAQAAEAAKAKDRFADRNCLRHTGSRVFRADRNGRKCAIGNGQAYTREDIDNTGSMDLVSALRMLHPGAR